MNTKSLSKNVLKMIREKSLVPTSRWIFVFKHVLFWTLFFISLFIGAKAIALTIHILTMEDLPLLLEQRPPIQILPHILPLFWIVSFMLFVAVASLGLQHTPKGYKWTLHKILIVNILLSIILGVLLYASGLARLLDRGIVQFVHPRLTAEQHRGRLWQHPEDGLLRGGIIEITGPSHFLLHDIRGNNWKVTYGSGALQREVAVASGTLVRLRGKKINDAEFEASSIVPDIPPHPMRGFMRPLKSIKRKPVL